MKCILNIDSTDSNSLIFYVVKQIFHNRWLYTNHRHIPTRNVRIPNKHTVWGPNHHLHGYKPREPAPQPPKTGSRPAGTGSNRHEPAKTGLEHTKLRSEPLLLCKTVVPRKYNTNTGILLRYRFKTGRWWWLCADTHKWS